MGSIMSLMKKMLRYSQDGGFIYDLRKLIGDLLFYRDESSDSVVDEYEQTEY